MPTAPQLRYATSDADRCTFESRRGACKLAVAYPKAFCAYHACPQPGCGEGKASTNPDCGAHGHASGHEHNQAALQRAPTRVFSKRDFQPITASSHITDLATAEVAQNQYTNDGFGMLPAFTSF